MYIYWQLVSSAQYSAPNSLQGAAFHFKNVRRKILNLPSLHTGTSHLQLGIIPLKLHPLALFSGVFEWLRTAVKPRASMYFWNNKWWDKTAGFQGYPTQSVKATEENPPHQGLDNTKWRKINPKKLKLAVEPLPTVSVTAEVQAACAWKTTAVSQPCCSISSPSALISALLRLLRAPAGPGPSRSSVWHCSRTGSGPWWPASSLSGWQRGPAAAVAPHRLPASAGRRRGRRGRVSRNSGTFRSAFGQQQALGDL